MLRERYIYIYIYIYIYTYIDSILRRGLEPGLVEGDSPVSARRTNSQTVLTLRIYICVMKLMVCVYK